MKKFADSPDNGYECDGNSGIAHGNPAHTSCTGQVLYINTVTVLGTVTLTDGSILSVLDTDQAAYITATPVRRLDHRRVGHRRQQPAPRRSTSP